MKYLSIILLALLTISCDDQFKLDYQAAVTIDFAGVDQSNRVSLDKGVSTYTAKINVKATGIGLSLLQIFEADNKTGEQGPLIQGQEHLFDEGTFNYSLEYTFSGMQDNECIKVVVTDGNGNTYERKLLVQITQSVIFTNTVTLETAESHYGIYFASWLNGRVYMREDGASYAKEIDLSFGQADLGAGPVPALISPAKRGDYGLVNLKGLQETKIALTTLKAADFNAITKVDASPIEALADPTQDAVEMANNKVYVFKTASGKKGLLYVTALTAMEGTVETPEGWVKQAYNRFSVAAKVLAWE